MKCYVQSTDRNVRNFLGVQVRYNLFTQYSINKTLPASFLRNLKTFFLNGHQCHTS